MAAPSATQRLLRPLAAMAATLVVIGAIAVIVRDDADDPGREVARSPADGGALDVAPVDGEGVASTVPVGEDPPASTSTSVADDRADVRLAVPAAGTYRYEVVRIRDGESETFEETRTFEVVTSEAEVSRLRLGVTTDGQQQVSILQWSGDTVTVRSTRLPTASGPGSECTWDPPIVEFGPLVAGSTWEVASSCTADVAGVPSTFTVTGTGQVVAELTIEVGGRDVRVWRIERVRTTVITAEIAGSPVEQRVEERGDLYVDPVRGLVVRSEAVLTRTGAQEGTTRREASLIE